MEAGPGFFGKLPSHGDFVTRRLPPDFVALWDGWLQAGMAASRDTLGRDWLDAYLGAPVWRFALAPGVCGALAWAGVLMPSVDRVGRHFPLTLASGCAGPLPLAQWMGEGDGWYGQVECLALSSLDAGFRFERFDEALRALPGLTAGVQAGMRDDAYGWRLQVDGLQAAVAAAGEVAQAALYGQGVWWSEGSERVAPCVLLLRGLPPAQAFAAMLAGWPPCSG